MAGANVVRVNGDECVAPGAVVLVVLDVHKTAEYNVRDSHSSNPRLNTSTITGKEHHSPNMRSSTTTPHYTFFSNKQIVNSGIKNAKPKMPEFG